MTQNLPVSEENLSFFYSSVCVKIKGKYYNYVRDLIVANRREKVQQNREDNTRKRIIVPLSSRQSLKSRSLLANKN